MGKILRKEEILYANENGKVTAVEVPLYGNTEMSIVIKPMVAQDIKEMMELGQKVAEAKRSGDEAKAEKLQKDMEAMDSELLDNHLIEPRISSDDLKISKPLMRDRIIKTIMIESGIPEANLAFGYDKEGKLVVPK